MVESNDIDNIGPIDVFHRNIINPEIYEILEDYENQRRSFYDAIKVKDERIEAELNAKHKNRIIRVLYRTVRRFNRYMASSCCRYRNPSFHLDISKFVVDPKEKVEIVDIEQNQDDGDVSLQEMSIDDYAIVIQCYWRGYVGREIARRHRMVVLAEVEQYWRGVLINIEEERQRKLLLAQSSPNHVFQYAEASVDNKLQESKLTATQRMAATNIQRCWRGYRIRKLMLTSSPRPESLRASPRKQRVKQQNQSESNRRNWARKHYVPEGGWPVDRVKTPTFDIFDYIDHPPSSTLHHTVHKVSTIPKTLKEKERLLHDSHSWVAVPVHVEDAPMPKTFTIKSPYLAPVVNFADHQPSQKLQKQSRDDYLLSLGWNPYTDTLPSDELNTQFQHTISATISHQLDDKTLSELDIDSMDHHDCNDDAKGFYESHAWDIRQQMHRGAYKPLSRSQLQTRPSSPQHHNHTLSNSTPLTMKDLLFQSATLFSTSNSIALTGMKQATSDTIKMHPLEMRFFRHHIKPPMRFVHTSTRPSPYIPPFTKKKTMNITSRRHMYHGVRMKNAVRWRLTAWGRVMMRPITSTANVKSKVNVIIPRSRSIVNRPKQFRSASKKHHYAVKYTWLPQPMLAPAIDDSVDGYSPLFLTDLESFQSTKDKYEAIALPSTSMDDATVQLSTTYRNQSTPKKISRNSSRKGSQRIIPLP